MSADELPAQLGSTGIQVPALGTGAWAWGDRLVWGYGRSYGIQEIKAAFEASLEAGINFFDTAEGYGQGQSERLLGRFVKASSQPVVIATKFLPYPWRLQRSKLVDALRRSLDRLEMEAVDLYQVHFPLPPLSIETWSSALADAVDLGLTRAVGVSNFNPAQTRRAHTNLVKRNIPLASNQVEFSLVNRRAEHNGLLKLCRELNITLIAYSPLAQGILTGKYSPAHPPPGIRGRRYNPRLLARIQPLIRLMTEIGEAHDGRSLAQVSLNWVICKGCLPIPGAKNAGQVQENAGALGWRLTDEDVSRLDEASANIS